MIQILTEELPRECDIKQIFKLLKLKSEQVDIKLCLEVGKRWFGRFLANEIPIYLMKGKGSLVDYLIFDTGDVPDPSVDVPIMAFEATKTVSSEAGNAIYQRLTKFIEIQTRWPSTRCVHFTSGTEQKNVSRSQIQQRRLASTLGVELYDGSGNILNSPPYSSAEELIHDRQSCTSAYVRKRSEHTYEINQPLTNGNKKGIDSDPGKGAVVSVANAIFILDRKAEFIVTGHGVDIDKIKNCKNKFWTSTSRFPLCLEGLKLCSTNAAVRETYCSIDNSGEKAASILLHKLTEKFKLSTIFDNHAGCGKSYFLTKDNEKIPVPKISYPDLVFVDKSNQTIFVIEAKNHREILKGDEQLNNINEFENMVKNNYNDYTVIKGLCVSAPNGWIPPTNLHHKIIFTLLDDGTFY